MHRHDLLLLHGGVYGQLAVGLGHFPTRPALDRRADAGQWQLELYPHQPPLPVLLSTGLVPTGPIQLVTWQAQGLAARDGIEAWWAECMTLFMRHV
ncbi:MAG: hypothetical protein ACOX5Z_00235 [Desulfobulbus sp.]|jgi:hypothetical protein